MRTAIQIITQALTGLAGQHWKRSQIITDTGACCVYRCEEGGLKCAVGHIMPDEEYDAQFDEKNIAVGGILVLVEDKPQTEFAKELKTHEALLIALQNWHDYEMYSDDMEMSWEDLADCLKPFVPSDWKLPSRMHYEEEAFKTVTTA